MLETRRGEMPQMAPPPMPVSPQPLGVHLSTPSRGAPQIQAPIPYPQPQPQNAIDRVAPMSYPQAPVAQQQMYAPHGSMAVEKKSSKLIWWIVGLLALGAAAGAVLALVMR
jgi:hypothetical protein